MTTMHASPPPNLVPAIPSAALPQTPAADWADDMHDTLGAHVTRTPVGTPGPDVPGAFPDALAVEKNYGDAAKEETLLESAKAYLPAQEDVARALSNAKAYLPQGVAAYFPGTDSTSTSTSAPAPQSVDIGHGASVPYTESAPEPYSERPPSPRSTTNSSTAVDVGHGASVPYTASAPEPYAAPAPPPLSAANSSTAVDVGHGASVPYTESAPAPYAPAVATPTPTRDESTMVHTGHSSSAVPPAAPRATSGLLPSHPAVAVDAAPLVQSPGALTPHASTDLALAAQTSLPPSYAPSTPSLVSGGASGYTASSESGLVQTPLSMSTEPSTDSHAHAPTSFSSHFSSQSQSEGPHAPQNSVATPQPSAATPGAAVTGSAALNSSDPKDLFPADTPAAYISAQRNQNDVFPSHGDAPSFGAPGSAALNSSAPQDLLPSGDAPAPNPNSKSDSSLDADGEADADADGDEDTSDAGAEEEKGKGGKKGKKPKLLQRLKEKMHVGGGSS